MFSCSGEPRGTALSRGEDGLYPEFRVPQPVAPLAELGGPRPWLFIGTKGIPVCCYSWDVVNPKAVIVLVHGYGGHCMFEWLQTESVQTAKPEFQDESVAAKTRKVLAEQAEGRDYEEIKSLWNCFRPALVAVSKDETEKGDLPGWEGISKLLSRRESMPLSKEPSSLGLSKLFMSKNEFMAMELSKEGSSLGLSKLFVSQSGSMANALGKNPSATGIDKLFMSRSGSMPTELNKEPSTLGISKLFMSRSGSLPVELSKDPSTLGISKLFQSRSGSMPTELEQAPSSLGLSKLFASRDGLTPGELSSHSSARDPVFPEMANKTAAASLHGCFSTGCYSDSISTKPAYSGSWVQRFVSSGHRVVGIDLQGHGASHGWDGASCQVETFNDLAQDIKTLLESLANEASIPIFLVGVGVGGSASVRAAELLAKAGVLGKPRPAEHQQESGEKGLEPKQQQEQQISAMQGNVEQQLGAWGSTGNALTSSSQKDSLFDTLKAAAKETGIPPLSEKKVRGTELPAPATAEAGTLASEQAGTTGVLHRLVWQKPVPLAGLVLLSPWLGELKVNGSGYNTCLFDSFLGALRGVVPHCGVGPRPPLSPETEIPFLKDPNTFKGRSKVNMLLEMKEGMRAALADAHWLKRQILRDPRDPLRLSDWAKLLHRRIVEQQEYKKKKSAALNGNRSQSLKGLLQEEWGEAPKASEKLSEPESEIVEEAQNYWRLSVLIVQSLDDAVLGPMGAIRLFEKLGGRAKAPQPWASELKEERRRERWIVRQQMQGRQHQPQKEETYHGEEETQRPQRGSSDLSIASESRVTEKVPSQVDREASKGLKTTSGYVERLEGKEDKEISLRLLSDVGLLPRTLDSGLKVEKIVADAKHQMAHERIKDLMGAKDQRNEKEEELSGKALSHRESEGKVEERVASDSGSIINGAAATEPRKEADETPEAEDQRGDKAQTGENAPAKGPWCSCRLSEAAESANVTTSEPTVAITEEGPPSPKKKPEAKKKGRCNDKGGKGVADKKLQCISYNCAPPQNSVRVPQRTSGLYTKKKHWGKVPGCLIDPHGRHVRVEEAQLLMEEVKASGFDPLPPELSPRVLYAEETTEEETDGEAETQKDEVNPQFERVTSVAAEGALQLWLLKAGGHELTKKRGNDELQSDIISSFIEPTINRIAKVTPAETS